MKSLDALHENIAEINLLKEKLISLRQQFQIRATSSVSLSMLESLQLFQFLMSHNVSYIPMLQNLKALCTSSNEEASTFLKSITDDPTLLEKLRGIL